MGPTRNRGLFKTPPPSSGLPGGLAGPPRPRGGAGVAPPPGPPRPPPGSRQVPARTRMDAVRHASCMQGSCVEQRVTDDPAHRGFHFVWHLTQFFFAGHLEIAREYNTTQCVELFTCPIILPRTSCPPRTPAGRISPRWSSATGGTPSGRPDPLGAPRRRPLKRAGRCAQGVPGPVRRGGRRGAGGGARPRVRHLLRPVAPPVHRPGPRPPGVCVGCGGDCWVSVWAHGCPCLVCVCKRQAGGGGGLEFLDPL